jgi:ribosomal protein S27E
MKKNEEKKSEPSGPKCPECKGAQIVGQRRFVEGYILVYCMECGHIITAVPDVIEIKVKKM